MSCGTPASTSSSAVTATAGFVLVMGPAAPASAALGDLGFALAGPWQWLDPRTAMGFAVIMGLVIFSTTLAIRYVRERNRWTERERRLAAELDGLRGAVDRATLLLGSERQVVVVWSGRNGEATLEGDPTVVGPGAALRHVLAFGSWIAPADAGRLEAALERLKERGEGFHQTLRTNAGGFVEAEGRTVTGRALLRLRDVTGERAVLLRVEAEAADAKGTVKTLRSLLDSVTEPVWLRRPDGRLSWVNAAYCKAVEAPDVEAVVGRSLELLDSADRRASSERRGRGETYAARVAAIVAGARRVLDVTEAPLPGGAETAGGMARDVSELEAARAELGRQAAAHVRMLDQLPNAVAMFDGSQKLVFHNAAYRQLWGLDLAFLETRPSDGEILDHLRAARRLPEQADYRSWKASLLNEYRSVEAGESWWHLPDRRTLRVVRSPNPQGGLTYLFDDVTDRMHLESRYNALIRVQGETLDTLAEGVALFGSDGRLKLFNRAFLELWRLDRAALQDAHVDAVVALGSAAAPADAWAELKAAVSGFSEMRLRSAVRMERYDGSVVDGAAEPLPDGATLLTFVDVTATVNVERALTERNEALELAARLRNEFVHHVSYELRSPLTNIIGFSELLGAETVGPLNERQRDYAGHITRSSGALLAIINDILDLASIDTDTIELARERVDILPTIEAAAAGIRDRLVETALTLEIVAPRDIGSFTGDGKRIRQVLYNLLSNAANFSKPGQTITVAAAKTDGEVIISVSDQGRGIPQEVQDRVFERFESHADALAHRGVGLGLSIVRSFVELHGGRVELVSEQGSGTTVTCRFPAAGRPQKQLAAALANEP